MTCPYCRARMTPLTPLPGWLCQGDVQVPEPAALFREVVDEAEAYYAGFAGARIPRVDGGPNVAAVYLTGADRVVRCGATLR